MIDPNIKWHWCDLCPRGFFGQPSDEHCPDCCKLLGKEEDYADPQFDMFAHDEEVEEDS